MFNLWDIYKRRFLQVEFLASLVVTVFIIGYIRSNWTPEYVDLWIIENKGNLYSLIASIGGTLLGFVITGVSIIIAFSDSKKLRLLTKSDQYQQIFKIYFSTIKYLAVTTVLSVIGLVIQNSNSVSINRIVIAGSWNIIVLYTLILVVTISIFRFYRCMWILQNIVEIIISTQNEH